MDSRIIYESVLNAMNKGPLLREEIIKLALLDLKNSSLGASEALEEKLDAMISDMLQNGVLEKSNGYYRRNSEKPVYMYLEFISGRGAKAYAL